MKEGIDRQGNRTFFWRNYVSKLKKERKRVGGIHASGACGYI
jgi:hypothetical protein